MCFCLAEGIQYLPAESFISSPFKCFRSKPGHFANKLGSSVDAIVKTMNDWLTDRGKWKDMLSHLITCSKLIFFDVLITCNTKWDEQNPNINICTQSCGRAVWNFFFHKQHQVRPLLCFFKSLHIGHHTYTQNLKWFLSHNKGGHQNGFSEKVGHLAQQGGREFPFPGIPVRISFNFSRSTSRNEFLFLVLVSKHEIDQK